MSVIAQNRYVRLDYSLRLDSGERLRGTETTMETLTFVAGCSELLPGLERRLWGLREQDYVELVVPAVEAFGLHDPDFVQEWSRRVFPPGMELEPGQKVLPANLPFEPEYPLTIKEVKGNSVILDMNHPLAGQDLFYAVRVLEVRPATEEELAPRKECQSCREGV